MEVAQQQQQSPTFGTLVVARSPQTSPSELELKLRQMSHGHRVVPHLSGGAHFLLPTSDSTVAVRAYDPPTIRQMDHQDNDDNGSNQREKLLNYLERLHNNEQQEDHNSMVVDDVDGLVAFRDSFKYTVVIFVLPANFQMEQLGRPNSFVSRAQAALASAVAHPTSNKKLSPSSSSTTTTTSHNNTASSNGTASATANPPRRGCARVFIVPNVESAVASLVSVIDALHPDKRARRRRFFEVQAAKNFLPSQQQQQPSPTTNEEEASFVATHVARVFRGWAERFHAPLGDVGVLMTVLPTLGNIVAADKAQLDNIPLDDRTKKLLLEFFGAGNVPFPDDDDDEEEPPLGTMSEVGRASALAETLAASQIPGTASERIVHEGMVLPNQNQPPSFGEYRPPHPLMGTQNHGLATRHPTLTTTPHSMQPGRPIMEPQHATGMPSLPPQEYNVGRGAAIGSFRHHPPSSSQATTGRFPSAESQSSPYFRQEISSSFQSPRGISAASVNHQGSSVLPPRGPALNSRPPYAKARAGHRGARGFQGSTRSGGAGSSRSTVQDYHSNYSGIRNTAQPWTRGKN